MISREVAVDEADQIVLVQREVGIGQQIAEDPRAQIGAVEDVPSAGEEAFLGKLAPAVQAEPSDREIGKGEDRQIGPDLGVGGLSAPVLLEPIDEELPSNDVESPVRVAPCRRYLSKGGG